jgi:hypothetical protein
MRLVEFLSLLLITHGESLKRLAALLGEDELVAILESQPEDTLSGEPVLSHEVLGWFQPPDQTPWSQTERRNPAQRSPYQELEWSVKDQNIPMVLQFYIWAYPPYRKWIERNIDLNVRFPNPVTPAVMKVIDEVIEDARIWVKKLPIAPDMAVRAATTAKNPWLKFRADVLKAMGHRPLQALRKQPS